MRVRNERPIPTIRSYSGKRDLPRVLSLIDSVGWAKRDPDVMEHAIAKSMAVFIALVDAQRVGFVRIVGDGSYTAFVCDLVVDPEWQRKRIGSELLEHCIKEAAIRGIPRLELISRPSARVFYERRGMVPVPGFATVTMSTTLFTQSVPSQQIVHQEEEGKSTYLPPCEAVTKCAGPSCGTPLDLFHAYQLAGIITQGEAFCDDLFCCDACAEEWMDANGIPPLHVTPTIPVLTPCDLPGVKVKHAADLSKVEGHDLYLDPEVPGRLLAPPLDNPERFLRERALPDLSARPPLIPEKILPADDKQVAEQSPKHQDAIDALWGRSPLDQFTRHYFNPIA